MYRTRPWMVVLLVTVTGLAVGFARLEGVHQPAPPEEPPAARPAPDHAAEEAEQVRLYLQEMVRYLEETESVRTAPVVLPPLSQLPPLPGEFLPDTTPGSEPKPT